MAVFGPVHENCGPGFAAKADCFSGSRNRHPLCGI
jgi:hypothetical protein